MDEQIEPAISEFFDGSPVPAFALDANHCVTQWNKACENVTGFSAMHMIGTSDHWKPFYLHVQPMLADLILNGDIEADAPGYYNEGIRSSSLIPGAFETERFFRNFGENGRWLYATAAPVHDRTGRVIGAIEILQDVTKQKFAEHDLQKLLLDLEDQVAKRTSQLACANERLVADIRQRETTEAELLRRNTELSESNDRLSIARQQLMQSEKMASIGQLAAGVAHEINNPISYIFSNFNTLEGYLAKMLDMFNVYEEAESSIAPAETRAAVTAQRKNIELNFLKEDIQVLMQESKEGIIRVRKIVQDLKDFSHVDTNLEWQDADIHHCIESTLNIVSNEVKYKADVIKVFGKLPVVECMPSQINQVIMNIVVNAAHAIGGERGRITIRTGVSEPNIWIEISDNGSGMPPEIMARIFEPFFTTKPVGSGTGLGLSLSYGIIQKHDGLIEVSSAPGNGTTFRITLPIRQKQTDQ